ncbi:hypothetical protein ACFFHM_16955 [Halalkalibacter kiskunsagensis]|uniref:Uncharacterized protein n=1 Tax=Halalkalibacter kiskunsagensis TaxID=1548599 RepID=A0ABV6KFR6_9BACI
MTNINGQIISGEFDKEMNEFILQKIKNQPTESIIKESQFSRLYRYLKEQEGSTGYQVITLYDQMLIPLSKDDLKALLSDLERLQHLYH